MGIFLVFGAFLLSIVGQPEKMIEYEREQALAKQVPKREKNPFDEA